jgi:hypothetical protein
MIVLFSIHQRSTEERPVSEALFLVDFDGLQLRQVSHVPTLAFLIKLALTYRELITNHLGATVIINANFLAENLIRIFKPRKKTNQKYLCEMSHFHNI